jgi:dTDP-L-rhamnose 4-epimerase
LLEQISRNPVRRIVVASSMSVYGEGAYRTDAGVPILANRRDTPGSEGNWNPAQPDGKPLEPIPTDETKPVDLASVYALTKFGQERSCQIIARAYGMEAVVLRVFNVFGPGQALSNPYTGVLANFGARLRHGRSPIVFEDGRQRRDFVHVTDVARGLRLAMECPAAAGHVINIGSGHVYTIAGVAEMLAAAMGVPHVRPQILGKARSGDIRHCFADIGKARALLGYAPQRILEDSLDELAAWIAGAEADDRGEIMRHQLEARSLMA